MRATLRLRRGASVGTVAQEAPGGEASPRQAVLAADRERARLLEAAESAQRPGRDRRGPDPARRHRRPCRAGAGERDPDRPGLRRGRPRRGRSPASRAAGGCGSRSRRCCSPSPTSCCSTSRPTTSTSRPALWLEDYLLRYPRTLLLVSHDRHLLEPGARADHPSRAAPAHRATPAATTPSSAIAPRAARAAGQGARQAGGQAAPHAGLRRPLPLQGEQGAPGAEPAQGAGAAGAARRGDRGRRSGAALSDAADPAAAPDHARRACAPATARRWCSTASTSGSIPTTGSRCSAPTATASRPSPSCSPGRIAPQAGEIVRAPKLRVGYFAQHQIEELRPERERAAASGRAAARPAAAAPARAPRRLRPQPGQGGARRGPALGRREGAPDARPDQRRGAADPGARRADQPPRHRFARRADRGDQRLSGRGAADQPRSPSDRAHRRSPVAGRGRPRAAL